MDFLQNWIRNIILVILLAHFIELLLPDNELRRYVKVVVGFFVIIVILTPLLKVTNQEVPGLDFNFAAKRRPSFAEIVEEGKQLRKSRQQAAKQEYRHKLSQQIEAVIKLNSELKDVAAEVKLAPNNNLQQIFIRGHKTKEGNNLAEEAKQRISDRRVKETRLQEVIATLYGLNQDQVTVNLQ